MAKQPGRPLLPLLLAAMALLPSPTLAGTPVLDASDPTLPGKDLRLERLDRLERIQDEKLTTGEIDPSQHRASLELLEQIRARQPVIDLPRDLAPGLVIPISARSPGHTEMPLPSVDGPLVLPAQVLLELLGPTALQDWENCRTAGRLVYDAACNLTAGNCPELEAAFRDRCFNRVTPQAPVTVFTGDSLQPIPFEQLERSLVVLRTQDLPRCTGVFLDARHVLTAAHCRPWIEQCQEAGPGCEALFHRIGSRAGTRFRLARLLTQEYSDDVSLDFDIWQTDLPAADARPLPILPLAATRPTEVDIPATIVGVTTFGCPPAGAANASSCPPDGTLWQPSPFTYCRVTCKTPGGALLHQCQTAPALSGAPILHWRDDRLILAGIHVEFDPGPRPAACPGESQIGVSMTGICQWINTNAPELGGSCLEN